jgi:hypothetical protein
MFMGVISLIGWLVLVVMAGLILVPGVPGRRALVVAAPALLSVAWLGVAYGLISSGVTISIVLRAASRARR